MRLYARGFNAAKRSLFGLMVNDVDLISTNPLHGVITPEVIANLRKSNDMKVDQKLRELGTKWVGHPHRHVKRKDAKEAL